jgi:sirohydrochlorin ferrochelatase
VLGALCARVAAHLPDWRVHGATLAKPGALERAMQAAGPAPLIYPMFMTDGWFVRSALPKRLAGAPHTMLAPFGVDPHLPPLIAGILRRHLDSLGWTASETTLLVAAHGSGRSDGPKRDTEAFVQALGEHLSFARVLIGYVEQPPLLADAAREAPEQALCLPFFAAEGGHVQEDLPEGLAEGGFAGPCLDPIGTLPEIPRLIAQGVQEAARTVTA